MKFHSDGSLLTYLHRGALIRWTGAMKSVQCSVIVDQIRANKDKTMTVKLGTQEMSDTDAAQLLGYMGKQIWCALAETPVKPDDLQVPEIMTEFKNDKSPSQRLRDRMYVFFTKKYQSEEGFHEWYSRALDKIGNAYLKNIE